MHVEKKKKSLYLVSFSHAIDLPLYPYAYALRILHSLIISMLLSSSCFRGSSVTLSFKSFCARMNQRSMTVSTKKYHRACDKW